MAECIIENLFKNPFLSQTFNDKIKIVTKGRPCPALSLLNAGHEIKYEYTHYFSASSYEKTPWLAGSIKYNKLFCWTCLLFSTEHSVWTRGGFGDLVVLSLAVAKHEQSRNHISCALKENTFNRSIYGLQQCAQKRIDVSEHNENVHRNRDVLKRLIDAVCYLSKQYLPFTSKEELLNPFYKRNYNELLQLISEYDPLLSIHLNSSCITVQNDVVLAVSKVMIDAVKEEVRKAHFVVIILDETSDVMNKSQLATILRYVNDSGKVQERFLFFCDVSANRSASSLCEHVMRVVDMYKIQDKLVGQTYDGACVMSGNVGGLEHKVREHYPRALFVQCYSHVLNRVLQQSLAYIRECRVFFHALSGLAAFFTQSFERTQSLHTFLQTKLLPIVCLNFSSELVNTVQNHREHLILFFKNLLYNSNDWDSDTIVDAQGCLSFLNSFQSRFLLEVFSVPFLHCSALYNMLQLSNINVACCCEKINEVKRVIVESREKGFERVWESTNQESKEPPCKRIYRTADPKQHYRRLFYDICDHLLVQIINRFSSFHYLDFISLLNSEKYTVFEQNFPEVPLNNLKEVYGTLFDIPRLKNELIVLYSTVDFQRKSASELVVYMHEHEIHVTMPEVFKLASLMLTLPCTTIPDGHSFSALKRIEMFCQATEGQERMQGQAILSIEAELLKQLHITSTLKNNVVRKFTIETGRGDFIFI